MNKEAKLIVSIINALKHEIDEEKRKKNLTKAGFKNLNRFVGNLASIAMKSHVGDCAKQMGLDGDEFDEFLGFNLK